MITAALAPAPQEAPVPLPASRWQEHWRQAIRDPAQLLAGLGLEAADLGVSAQALAQFPLRVPRGFAARMRPRDAADPLLRQVLPVDAEMQVVPGFSFAADPSIDEVILSGGDPLSLATAKLAELTDALATIPHIKRLRIHSRLPVVLPERVDEELVRWLAGLPWPLAFVIHANHANEFDPHVDAALARLRGAGAQLLNQAVLLRGVNDDVEALAALSERSFAAGVLPYYLHQLDRVQGVAHFEVSDARALELHAALMARLSGYLVPKLVREIAGDTGKRPL